MWSRSEKADSFSPLEQVYQVDNQDSECQTCRETSVTVTRPEFTGHRLYRKTQAAQQLAQCFCRLFPEISGGVSTQTMAFYHLGGRLGVSRTSVTSSFPHINQNPASATSGVLLEICPDVIIGRANLRVFLHILQVKA